MARKKCPACGSSFNCEGDSDCWCEQVQIHRAQLQLIMEKYDDCLCPGCLKQFEAKE